MEANEIPLSSSMEDVRDKLSDSDSVTSWELVRVLLDSHPGYGGGLGGKLREMPAPEGGMNLPVKEWIVRAYDLYDPTQLEMGILDGRLMIWALSRIDPTLWEYLQSYDFINPLEKEIIDMKGAIERLVRDRSILEDKDYQQTVQVESSEEVETTATAYLLTWNPSGFPFSRFKPAADLVRDQGSATLGWSSGNRTHVSVGDRVFLMRQGEEPRGLVGSGRITEGVKVLPHYNEQERRDGKTYNQVMVLWDTLQELPVLPVDELTSRTGEEDLWKRQVGGTEIKKEVLDRLEPAWEEALSPIKPPPPPTPTEEALAPLAWVETDAIPVIGARRAFQLSKQDSLNVEAQAKIFATLLVAEYVRPPLALGLLGEWGVGKTFFMRLMQETVASIAGRDIPSGGNSGSVSRAAQIEFNAWHYVDSDLWASLASHIFDGLAEELRGPQDKVEEVRRRLRRTIHSSRLQQEEAAAAITAAQEERKQAAEDLEQIQAQREHIAASYEEQRLQRIWQAVLRVKPGPDHGDWPDMEKLKDEAEHTAKRLGISEAIDSAEEAQRVYNTLQELSQRGTGLTYALASDFTGGRLWVSAGVVLVLLVLVILWPYLLSQLEVLLNLSEEAITRLLAPLLEVSTIVGAALVWVSKNLKSISSAMSYLEAIQQELNNPRIEPAEASEHEKKLKEQIEKFDAQIATEQGKIAEADRRIAEAQAEIQRINAGGLVYDFLEGRVRDTRYLDRLGLISVIRQDFEELDSLLNDWRVHSTDEDGQEQISDEERWNTRPIQRIILYIDDLDRCPPKRVVEVLQAVHLLLAFDLFVVVVAVDARWLERSLNEAYNPWTAKRDGSPPEEPLHRFSAQNYLEKIFQIPFSLPAMNEVGYRKLIVDLVETPRAQAEVERPRSEPEQPVDEPGVVGVDDDRLPGDTPTKDEEEVKLASLKDDEEEEMRRREEQIQLRREEKEREEASKRIEAMLLQENEKLFISALYQFIDTPRLAKRFINIYRLLRVRAAALEEDFSTFIGQEHGDYRAVLMLLAIIISRPNVAAEILDDLHMAKGNSFRKWLEDMSKQYEEERSQLRTERIAQENQTDPSSASEREIRLAELRDATFEIRASIDPVEIALNELNGPTFNDQLPIYSKWAREVGRYSFHWHLKAES